MMSSHMFICPKCKGCFSIEDGKSTICPSCNQPMSRTVYTRDEVVIVPNMPDGGVDRESINRILTERSNSGWQLVTAYSNELGHNSSSGGFGGFSAGTNTTVCQDVLYFRRLIANVDR